MARIDELRLLTKVSRMYHERGLRQAAIADQLNLSQATISRLLKRAEEIYLEMMRALLPGEKVHLLVADAKTARKVKVYFPKNGTRTKTKPGFRWIEPAK